MERESKSCIEYRAGQGQDADGARLVGANDASSE